MPFAQSDNSAVVNAENVVPYILAENLTDVQAKTLAKLTLSVTVEASVIMEEYYVHRSIKH